MSKFLTPVDVPTDVVCRTLHVPNSLAWLGIFNKALLATTLHYNWSDDVPGNMTREDAAEAARVVVRDFLDGSLNCELCLQPDGEPIVRLNSLGEWEVLDGTWVPPSGDYAIPAYTARTETTAEERKCLAAKNAVDVLAQTYEEMTDVASQNLDTAESILSIGAFIAAIIVAPIGALAVAGMLVVIKAVEFALAITEFVTEDVWTTEYTEALVCTFLNNAIDTAGVVTFDFAQMQIDVLEMAIVFDLTLRQQQLAVQVNFMLEILGVEGINLAGETTAITDSDCSYCGSECPGLTDWCVTLFAQAAQNPGGFTPTSTEWGTHGVRVQEPDPSFAWIWLSPASMSRGTTERATLLNLVRTLQAGTYTRFDLAATIDFGNFTTDIREFTVKIGSTTLISETVDSSGDLFWEGEIVLTTPTDLTINAVMSYTNLTGSSNGGCALYNCSIGGSGTQPTGF